MSVGQDYKIWLNANSLKNDTETEHIKKLDELVKAEKERMAREFVKDYFNHMYKGFQDDFVQKMMKY